MKELQLLVVQNELRRENFVVPIRSLDMHLNLIITSSHGVCYIKIKYSSSDCASGLTLPSLGTSMISLFGCAERLIILVSLKFT